MNMKPIIVTPATQVITQERAKLHCKITGSRRDSDIDDAIEAARSWMQKELAVAVGPQRLKFVFDDWAGSACLPYDITDVVSVSDGSGPLTFTRRGRVISAAGTAPVEVVVDCGWTAQDVPGTVKSAMLLMIGDLVENPTGQVEVQLYQNPAIENLIALERQRSPI